MKITFQLEKVPLIEGHYIFRWDADVSPEDRGDISAEQMQEELRIGFNEQLNSWGIAKRLW